MTISRSTSRPIRARISRGALQHNYRQVRQFATGAKAWAVIKANAYGHGQWRAVEALREEADGFAVLECENAVALRLCIGGIARRNGRAAVAGSCVGRRRGDSPRVARTHDEQRCLAPIGRRWRCR